MTGFQRAGRLRDERLAVRVEDHENRQPLADRVLETLVERGVVLGAVGLLVHVHQDHLVILREGRAERLVRVEQPVEPVAPDAPIRPKHRQHPLVPGLGPRQGVGQLLLAVGGAIVDRRALARRHLRLRRWKQRCKQCDKEQAKTFH